MMTWLMDLLIIFKHMGCYNRASAYQGHTYTAFAIALLAVLFCSKGMAGLTQKRPALSDITNTGTLIDYTMQKLTSTYMPSSLPTVCK